MASAEGAFKVEYSRKAAKALGKLDARDRAAILAWVSKNLEGCDDPRAQGKPLAAGFKGQWRYRVGDYRLIAEIVDNRVVIIVLAIGHRKDIYR
ncbi:MAG: type II toxin-antitoxin system RelE/ParE family toxin [Coriobacteriales bacterium]|jgi:mRNA interferase RelE/StbE|nr:type II toxin-antitoxin system RelE/ParE family toxin [Coriobacteriales bacterium]